MELSHLLTSQVSMFTSAGQSCLNQSIKENQKMIQNRTGCTGREGNWEDILSLQPKDQLSPNHS